MALPDSAKYIDGTSFIFAFDTDWPASPTAGWSATVDGEIDLGGLANGSYRQSVKVDLTANRDVEYKVEVSVETEADATAGGTIDVYYYTSDSATAGTGNMGGCRCRCRVHWRNWRHGSHRREVVGVRWFVGIAGNGSGRSTTADRRHRNDSTGRSLSGNCRGQQFRYRTGDNR